MIGMVEAVELAASRAVWLRRHPGYRGPRTLARAAVWSVRAAMGRGATVSFAGGAFYCPPEQRGMARLAYIFGDTYEAELAVLSDFVNPGQSVLDIGANYGAYTIALAMLVGPSGSVVAFEPSVTSVKTLRQNIALNGFSNVTVEEKALSDRNGTASFLVHADASRSRLDEVGDVTVQLARVDDLGLGEIHFVKIDVEGGEPAVLRGADRLIREQRPVILYEQSPGSAIEAWDFLVERGYVMHLVEGRQWRQVKTPPAGVANLLALPA